MKKSNLFMAAAAASVAAASVALPGGAAAAHPFTDVGSRYDEAVNYLYENKLVNGVSSVQFGTEQPLTRGDAAVILARLLELETENAPDAGFTDVNSRMRGAVNALAEIGIVSGMTPTQFKPTEPLSRGAMAKFLVTAFQLESYAKATPFTDAAGVFKPSIEALHGAGIATGKTANSYGTHENIIRGDFANLLYKTIEFTKEGTYVPKVASINAASAATTEIVLEQAVPAGFTATDMGGFFSLSAEFSDGTRTFFDPTAYSLSEDRKTLVVEHANQSLAGQTGTLFVDDHELVREVTFNFPAVTASAAIQTLIRYITNLPGTIAE